MRGFTHALQFLTRLPAPRLGEFQPADLSRSAVWFPVIGTIVGAAVVVAVWTGTHASPWIGALLGLLVWVWTTGGLHLDGLGDVADALAAAHRSPDRFLEVLRDPHIGAFGVIAIVLQLISKLVLLAQVASSQVWLALVLIPAWARWGPLVWSRAVPPLASGSGERFSWEIGYLSIAVYAIALTLLSAWASPILIGALVIIPAIAAYWKYRLGGITGDCLGAGIEVCETLLLLLVAAGSARQA